MNKTILCVAAVAATTGLATADAVPVTETDQVAELTAKVNDLQARLDAMQAENGDDWLTEQRAEEIRGLVQDVLADADTRASMLQSGMTAGWDKKFFIGSADGNFRLNIGGQVQVRFVYNHQQQKTVLTPFGPVENTDDKNRSGFENRRAKVKFTGHVVDPSWQYAVGGAFERSGGDFRFEDVWILKDFENGWKVKGGSFKLPFNREELTSSSRQLLVDRSLVNERFNLDRGEGIEVSWSSDQFRAMAAYSDGIKSRRSSALAYDTEYAMTARLEFLAMGDWGQFKDFTSWRGSERGLMLGTAVHYQSAEFGTVARNELTDLRFTADLSYEADGYNVFASFIWTDLDNDAPSGDPASIDYSPWGLVVQGGLFLTDDWELFARYEYGDDDGGPNSTVGGLDDMSVLTMGVNRYWSKHGLKWSTDVGYGFDPAQGAWGAHSGVGWRDDTTGEDGQIVIRSQFQLLF